MPNQTHNSDNEEDILVDIPLGAIEVTATSGNRSEEGNGRTDPMVMIPADTHHASPTNYAPYPRFTPYVQSLLAEALDVINNSQRGGSTRTQGGPSSRGQDAAPNQPSSSYSHQATETAKEQDSRSIAKDEESQKAQGANKPPMFPECFYCPITKQIMMDPVVHPNGNSFERGALVNDGGKLYTNRALKTYIQQEVQRQEEAGSLRGTIRAWNKSISSGVQKIAAPTKYRPLPDSFYCPITCSLMYDPVIDPEGNTFEREAIVKWVNAHASSPVTRSPLAVRMLYDNNALFNALVEETTTGGDDEDNDNDNDNGIHPSIRACSCQPARQAAGWKEEVAAREARALARHTPRRTTGRTIYTRTTTTRITMPSSSTTAASTQAVASRRRHMLPTSSTNQRNQTSNNESDESFVIKVFAFIIGVALAGLVIYLKNHLESESNATISTNDYYY